MKYLIVDDNKNMRETIALNIKQKNDIIYECEDGDEALDTFLKYKPDWIFMDIKMERINGLRATEEIKKHYPDAKIIIVSNYNSDVFRKVAMSAGANGFVEKRAIHKLNEQLSCKF